MAKEDRNERIRQATEKLRDMFASDELPRAVAQTLLQPKPGDAPSRRWSLGNRLLMYLAGTSDARGYRQWEAAGRRVKRGAKAFYIFAPLTRKVTETVTVTNGEGEEEEQERERVVVTGFRPVPVFRVEDTEGEPLEETDYSPPELPPLYDVAEAYGLSVRYVPADGRYRGAYVPGTGEIILCTHDVRTFFHELAHAAHFRVSDVQPAARDPYLETVAETAAAVLCILYDVQGYVPHSREYIEHYARGENALTAMLKVISDVQKVLEDILSTAERIGQGEAA